MINDKCFSICFMNCYTKFSNIWAVSKFIDIFFYFFNSKASIRSKEVSFIHPFLKNCLSFRRQGLIYCCMSTIDVWLMKALLLHQENCSKKLLQSTFTTKRI